MTTPVPPLGGSLLVLFLLQLAVLLVLALALGRLATRFGMPALVGELFAGVLLGPTVLGHTVPALHRWLFPTTAAQVHLLEAFMQVGVLLLVAITGAQFDSAMVRKRGTAAFGISMGGLLLPLGLGIVTGYVLVPDALVPDGTRRAVFAVFLGVAMCVTAIPVIAKTLADLDLLHRNIGQLILASALFDDTVGWLLLAVVAAMATGGAVAGAVPVTVAYLVLFVAAAVLVGRPLARVALRAAERTRDPGPTIAIALVIVFGYGALTAAAKLEALFGAFVAGLTVLSLANPARLAPLRTIVMAVLAPIFLAGIGLRMDLTTLAQPLVLFTGLAVLAVAMLGKFTGVYVGARLGRLGHWEATALGFGMNSRGMVEVVIALAGLRLGVLNTATFTIVVLVAIITSLTTPPLLRAAMRRLPTNDEERVRQLRHAAWHVRSAA